MTLAVPHPLCDQLSFLIELEKLKLVLRRNRTVDGSRNENSAEHSWHVAIMAFVLQEHTNKKVDLPKVLKMLLIHDIVEIHAGDTWLYAEAADQNEREREAAAKLFGMLPPAQSAEMLELWNEFEAGASDEAGFAKAVDAFQPLLNHLVAESAASDEPRPQLQDGLEMKKSIAVSSLALWEAALHIIELSADRGLYARS